MNYSQAKRAIKSGRDIFNEALTQYPATVIYSVANETFLGRMLPSPCVRGHTDRHQRAAIRIQKKIGDIR